MKSGGFLGFTAAASAVALVSLGAAALSDARADGKRDTLYVSDSGANTVQTFDSATGFPKGILIPAAGQPNPFQSPLGLVFHDDDLPVVNQNVDEPIPGEILRFDKETGKLLMKVVPAFLKNGNLNLDAPFAPRGIVFWRDRIVVATFTDDFNSNTDPPNPTPAQGSVREYTESGRLILPTMMAPLPPDSFHPRGVVIGPDGLIYASNSPKLNGPFGQVFRFDPQERKFVDTFIANNDGTAKDCTANLNRPEGLVFGPDGRLYVTTFRASGAVPGKDSDAILVFEGPDSPHPGACVDQINLDKPGTVSPNRAFAQALLFGPHGDLFVPITGNGPDTGAIRRYDVRTQKFTNFAPPGTLQQAFYLTFGRTDPATLSYPEE
jgi:sugar lactone lactonase YvrE